MILEAAAKSAEAVVPWWQAGGLSLISVIAGALANHLGNRSTQERLLAAQRDDRLRPVLADLLTHGRFVTDQFMTLAPVFANFEEHDWMEWPDTDSGQAIGDAQGKLKHVTSEAWLLCPAGPLRDALDAYRTAVDDPENQPRGLTPQERQRHGLRVDDAIGSTFAVYGKRRRLLDSLEAEAVAYFSRTSTRPSLLARLRARDVP